jgi:hypothetical protein
MTLQSHIVENAITVDYELTITWTEAIVAYSKAILQHLPGGTENEQVQDTDFWAYIRDP